MLATDAIQYEFRSRRWIIAIAIQNNKSIDWHP